MSTDRYHLVVLGGGPGGYVAALRARQLGIERVCVVEKEHLGGVCANWGCIPTKALLHSADLVSLVKEHGGEHGLSFDGLRIDYRAAQARSRAVADRMAQGVRHLLRKSGVDVLEGTGRLAGRNTVEVEPGARSLTADRVIVATGARPRTLPGLEVDGRRVLTSRHALELTDLPEAMLIIGGGAIGCEFASLFAAYGVKVTLLEALPRLLPAEEEEVSRALAKAFERRGITVRTGVKVESAEVSEGGVTVRLAGEGGPVTAPQVLVAIGVQANVEGIGLDEAGVEVERGFVRTGEFMETSVPGIYAIGDCNGRPPFLAHVASEEGIVAVEHLAGKGPRPLAYRNVPRVTFCKPQVASVGLTEAEAREQGREVRTATFPLRANGRAMALGEPDGFCKVVADARYGEVLGVHCIGPEVTELISEGSLALTLEATAEEIAAASHPHPTLSEVVKEAALAALGRGLHA